MFRTLLLFSSSGSHCWADILNNGCSFARPPLLNRGGRTPPWTAWTWPWTTRRAGADRGVHAPLRFLHTPNRNMQRNSLRHTTSGKYKGTTGFSDYSIHKIVSLYDHSIYAFSPSLLFTAFVNNLFLVSIHPKLPILFISLTLIPWCLSVLMKWNSL